MTERALALGLSGQAFRVLRGDRLVLLVPRNLPLVPTHLNDFRSVLARKCLRLAWVVHSALRRTRLVRKILAWAHHLRGALLSRVRRFLRTMGKHRRQFHCLRWEPQNFLLWLPWPCRSVYQLQNRGQGLSKSLHHLRSIVVAPATAGLTFQGLDRQRVEVPKCLQVIQVHKYIHGARPKGCLLTYPCQPNRQRRLHLTRLGAHRSLSYAKTLLRAKLTGLWTMLRRRSVRSGCAVLTEFKTSKRKRRRSHRRCLGSNNLRCLHQQGLRIMARNPRSQLLIDIRVQFRFLRPLLSPFRPAWFSRRMRIPRARCIIQGILSVPCISIQWEAPFITRWAVPYTTLPTCTVRCITPVTHSMEHTLPMRVLCIMVLLLLMGYLQLRPACPLSHSCLPRQRPRRKTDKHARIKGVKSRASMPMEMKEDKPMPRSRSRLYK